MFAKTIIDSDAFIDMPLSTQALYFHIGLSAMDKGVVNNIYSISRKVGCDPTDVENLLESGFIKVKGDEADGIYEIVHWYENNGIGETAKKRNNYKYRQWRSEVIARDGFRCTECGGTEDLVAHHIKPFASYPLERFEVSNGITLCARCHRKTHKEARMNG
jgi:hypothetical protein